jgi:hypothetical protein
MRNEGEQAQPHDRITAWYQGDDVVEGAEFEAIRRDAVERDRVAMPSDPARLVRQREAVMSRIEREGRRGWMLGRWVTALAATAALAAGIYVYVPGSTPEAATRSETVSFEEDAKLFAEVAELAAAAEPQAAAPVSALLAAGE